MKMHRLIELSVGEVCGVLGAGIVIGALLAAIVRSVVRPEVSDADARRRLRCGRVRPCTAAERRPRMRNNRYEDEWGAL